MATHEKNLQTEIIHFMQIKDFEPISKELTEKWNTVFKDFGYKTPPTELLRKLQEEDHLELLKKGNLQVSTIWENVLAFNIGCEVKSVNNGDLSNGDEAKLVTTQLHGTGALRKDGTRQINCCYEATISNIKNKKGYILAQVYEKNLKKFYYFMIPYSEYGTKSGKHSAISIRFDRNTYLPKRENKWWKYEVGSFENLIKLVKERN